MRNTFSARLQFPQKSQIRWRGYQACILVPKSLCEQNCVVDFKMADRGVPTVSELKKFKVVELKAKLQELGLPVNGKF